MEGVRASRSAITRSGCLDGSVASPMSPRSTATDCQRRIIGEHSANTGQDGVADRSEALDIPPGLSTGYPLALARSHGSTTIQARCHFQPHPGPPGVHALHETRIQANSFFRQQAFGNLNASLPQHIQPASRYRGIRILGGGIHMGDTGINQRPGTGRCTTKVAARLQGYIGCRSPGVRTGLTQGADLSVGFSGTLMPALTEYQIAAGNDTANPGIGMGRVPTAPGKLDSPRHHGPVAVLDHAFPFGAWLSASALATSTAASPLLADNLSISSLNSLISWKLRYTEAKRT